MFVDRQYPEATRVARKRDLSTVRRPRRCAPASNQSPEASSSGPDEVDVGGRGRPWSPLQREVRSSPRECDPLPVGGPCGIPVFNRDSPSDGRLGEHARASSVGSGNQQPSTVDVEDELLSVRRPAGTPVVVQRRAGDRMVGAGTHLHDVEALIANRGISRREAPPIRRPRRTSGVEGLIHELAIRTDDRDGLAVVGDQACSL